MTDTDTAKQQTREPIRRSQHLLMLEFGDRDDFDNPRLEWRRLVAVLA